MTPPADRSWGTNSLIMAPLPIRAREASLPPMSNTSDHDYQAELQSLQLAPSRSQQYAMEAGEKVLIIFEGRDAAGKDGAIQHVTEHLSVRATKVVALPKPSDFARTQWYFQRYVHFLPGGAQTTIL